MTFGCLYDIIKSYPYVYGVGGMRTLSVVLILIFWVVYGVYMLSDTDTTSSNLDEKSLTEFLEELTQVQEIPEPEKVSPIVRDKDEILLEEIVAGEMLRLRLFKRSFKEVKGDIIQFLEFVKLTESDGNHLAKAKTSSAMSLFQFTTGSVPTAVNRLSNYMMRHHMGTVPGWAIELKERPHLLFETPETRQAILTLINIIERRGSDELLKKFLAGDMRVAKEIYFRHHHTEPDEATTRRAKRIFSKVFQSP